VGIIAAVESYVVDVLTRKPDEQAVLGTRIGTPSDDTASLRLTFSPPDDPPA
jgi:hypothetical protein